MNKSNKKAGLVPRLRFPEFRKDEAWKNSLVRNFFALEEPKEKTDVFDNDKVITVKLHTLGVVRNERASTLTGGANYFNRKAGQFIFSKIDLLNGAFGLIPEELDGFCSSSDVPAFSFKDNQCALYFLYWLKTNYQNLKIERTGTSSTLKRVSPSAFLDIQIPLPTLSEQQKIADCLSSLDDLITAQSQEIDALKAHKKGLMKQLFPQKGETVPRLRFPEFGNAKAWEYFPLGAVAQNLDNRRIPITENNRSRGDIPYYGASGIVDYVADFIFNEDLLCVSEDGANLTARTTPIAFPVSGKTWVNNHAHVLRFKQKCTQQIVENYLNAIKLDDFLTGMAQPKLNKAMLEIIPIPLSSLPEQQKIADCLSSLDDLINLNTQKLDLLKAHKKGLMQQLFPGESAIR